MKKDKLIQLIKTLSAEELIEFEEFINAPFFNKEAKCIQLFELIKPYAPHYDDDNLDKTTVFKQLFPDKKRMTSYFSVVRSKLTRLIEEYIVYKRLNDNHYYKKYLLLEGLLKRNERKHFNSIYQSVHARHSEQKRKGSPYYMEKYLLETVHYDFLHGENNRKLARNPKEVLKALDIYYTSTKLHLMCEMLTVQSVMSSTETSSNALELITPIVKSSNCASSILVETYHASVMTLKEGDNDEHFRQLKALLPLAADELPEDDLKHLYSLAANHCIRKVRQGKNYLRELFEVYKDMVKYGLLFNGQYMPPAHIKNIVGIGCKLKDFEWSENFLHNHKMSIAPKYRNDVYHFNLGVLFFYKGEYDKAQLNLIQVGKVDAYFDINNRFLLLKTYYHLNETIALFSLADSFKAFLRNNKSISHSNRKGYLNASNIIINLYKIKHGEGRKTLDKVESTCHEMNLVSDKRWIMERINELKPSVAA